MNGPQLRGNDIELSGIAVKRQTSAGPVERFLRVGIDLKYSDAIDVKTARSTPGNGEAHCSVV